MDMIFVLDEEARFVDINPAGLEVLGYAKPEDVLGIVSICRLFVVEEQCDRLMSDLELVGYVRDRECILQAVDGSEKFFLLSAAGRKDKNGKIIIYEGIAKDITSWVSMQRQLQQADRLASLGQISTGIAHEVNNPLGVILAYTQLLLRDYPPESQIHDDLRIIEKHARNCKSVVEDLLKFARGTRTNKTTTNVNQCLTEVLSLLAHQFELDHIVLTTDLDEELPNINADDEKLKQVFMNLLMNAKQAISGQGRISVESKMGPERSTMLVSVSDNGSGIRPGHLDKIFDPFFTTKAVGEGTGLGLSVSYGIVRDHNGRIDVSSRLGVGSTFSIVLPLDDQNPVPERVANAQ
jgi:two-component system, NtrC family, sensor kinase